MSLPPGFRISSRFDSRLDKSRFGNVQLDSRLPFFPSNYDTPEQSEKKTLELEKHFRKHATRIRRDTALTGKAGRPALPETVELYQKRFIEKKSWKQCFAEFWAAPGRKAPVPHERARVMRRLRDRAKAYAAGREKDKK
jgi:hypothetical protein